MLSFEMVTASKESTFLSLDYIPTQSHQGHATASILLDGCLFSFVFLRKAWGFLLLAFELIPHVYAGLK